MALSDKKVLVVVPPRDFDGQEFDLTRKVLESKGLKLTVASTALGSRPGTGGITANAQKLVKDCKSYDYDAVVFIGGPGAREIQSDKDMTRLAEDVKYKCVGAFSTAVAVLANGKAVKDKRVTGDRTVVEAVHRGEGKYTGQPLEIDEKIITAEGSRVAVHLANALLEALKA